MVCFDIGVTGFHQPLDQRAHLGNVLGRARLRAWRQAAERRGILVELPIGLFRDLADRLVQGQRRIFLRRAGVDLVVDVGDVTDIGDVRGAVDMPE